MRNLIIGLGLIGSALVPAVSAQQPERVPGLAGMEHTLARLEHTLARLEHVDMRSIEHALGSLEHVDMRSIEHAHAGADLHALTALHALSDLHAPAVLPPAAWAPQDPADSLWRAAREALNANDATRAARLYRQIRTESRFARSEYRAPAFYWEAYARHRIGSVGEMRSAQDILQQLRRTHANYPNMAEVERLATRIDADLAARGDANAGARASSTASQAASAQCPDQELRISALESLITMPSETAMPLLVQVMGRKDACNAPLREKAVFLISQKRSSQAEDLLLDAARSDPSSKVREQAVFWLSQVNSDKAVTAIEEILRTSTNDPKLMEHAVFALSQNRSPRAAQLLRDMAGRNGASIEARKNAIFWLGQRRDAETGTYLRTLYESLDNAQLKDAVIFALSQRRDDGSGDFLLEIALNEREPVEARKQALFWAGQQRALPLNRIVELYDRMPSREMKEQIIFVLSQRREPEAVERMIDIARRERDTELRKNIIFWLGQSRDPRAVRYISELIGG